MFRTTRLRRTQKKDGDSASASNEDGGFDAAESLRRYGLPSLDHGHMLPFDQLKKIKSATQKVKTKAKGKPHSFIVDKEALKCPPQWMKEKDKPTKTDMNHAQWVAVWWARALGQLIVQAAVDHETVSFETLLNQFLNCSD